MLHSAEKIAIVSVTNNLLSDYRVHKTCLTLIEMGYTVTLVGRNFPPSSLAKRPYQIFRFKLLFNKKIFFYAEYNIRLFLFLLFKKVHLLVSNDLDTLLANFLISRIKHIPLLYDSHEYFTEVPELINRPLVKRIWHSLEKFIVPKLPHAITVNHSLAAIYNNLYGVPFYVIRNVPELKSKITEKKETIRLLFSSEVKHILLYQGALNVGRGIELLIRALVHLDNTFALLIIGSGDIEKELKQLVKNLQLTEKVNFLGKIPFEELPSYTSCAFLGFSLEDRKSLNYYYSLPNKVLDYIHAGVPIVCRPYPEIKAIVEEFNVGVCTDTNHEQELAHIIKTIASDKTLYMTWKNHCMRAAQELCWEKEKLRLKEIVQLTVQCF